MRRLFEPRMEPGSETLQRLVERLPRFGTRNAIGLRREAGLRWWSYAELHRMALRAAILLERAGVGKGDRVLFQAKSSPEWMAFFLGAMWRGAVAVPVDDDSSPGFVRRVAAEVAAKLHLTATGGEPCDSTAPRLDLDSLYDQDPTGAPDPDPIRVEPSDAAVIFFTSGTTSAPRGVVLSHRNLWAQVERFQRWRLLARLIPARMLVMAPMSHVQGLVLGLCIPLSLGLAVIRTHSNHSSHLIRVLRDNRVVLFSTVPRSLHVLASAFQQQRYGRSCTTLGDKLRTARNWLLYRHYVFTATRKRLGYRLWIVLVGGAPLPAGDERFWRNTGCLFIQGYGLTETAAVISVNAPLFGAFGSVGRPASDSDLRIAEDGEILVRGPAVMSGYAGRGEEPAESAYFPTGDLGRLDKRKRLYIVGRKKDMIVTGEGFNVYPGDVEQVLNSYSGVRDCVVLGAGRDGHQEVHATLLLAPGALADATVREANRVLPAYQKIRSWTVWPEPDFPRTSLQKVRRRDVEARLASLQLPARSETGGDAPLRLDEILRIGDRPEKLHRLAAYIAAGSTGDREAERTAIGELGLSSLDTAELLFLLEQTSDGFASRLALNENATIAELRALARGVREENRTAPEFGPEPPRWADNGALVLFRRLINFPLFRTWLAFRARLNVEGLDHLDSISGPLLFACSGHEHAADVLLIYCALPPRLRRRIAIVSSRWVFAAYLQPAHPGFSVLDRAITAAAFHFLVPLHFPFALSSNYAAANETLVEICRLIDRGYSPVAFEGEGLALAARQTGRPIIPVHLEGNAGIGFAPRRQRASVTVRFGPSIIPLSGTSDEQLSAQIAVLSSQGAPEGGPTEV